MALGLWIGRKLAIKLSREAFVQLVTWLVTWLVTLLVTWRVLASDVALIARYLSA